MPFTCSACPLGATFASGSLLRQHVATCHLRQQVATSHSVSEHWASQPQWATSHPADTPWTVGANCGLPPSQPCQFVTGAAGLGCAAFSSRPSQNIHAGNSCYMMPLQVMSWLTPGAMVSGYPVASSAYPSCSVPRSTPMLPTISLSSSGGSNTKPVSLPIPIPSQPFGYLGASTACVRANAFMLADSVSPAPHGIGAARIMDMAA